jgi:hypothetical protein
MGDRNGPLRPFEQEISAALENRGWQSRRTELMQDLFRRFDVTVFSVYEAARLGVLLRPVSQRRYCVGAMAGHIQQLVKEGVLVEVVTRGRYPKICCWLPAGRYAARKGQ